MGLNVVPVGDNNCKGVIVALVAVAERSIPVLNLVNCFSVSKLKVSIRTFVMASLVN